MSNARIFSISFTALVVLNATARIIGFGPESPLTALVMTLYIASVTGFAAISWFGK